MRTIILTSAGMQVKDELLKILPGPASMLRFAHIITATKGESDLTYLEAERKIIKEAEFQVEEIDIEGMSYEDVRAQLQNFDIVYVQGGNTFLLMKAMHECNFAVVVRELLDRGVIYVGVSAGSIVAGPDIAIAGWKGGDQNQVGLKDLTGLFLVDFGIFPHFEDKITEDVGRGIMTAPYKVKFLHDNEFFLVRDEKIDLIKV